MGDKYLALRRVYFDRPEQPEVEFSVQREPDRIEPDSTFWRKKNGDLDWENISTVICVVVVFISCLASFSLGFILTDLVFP